MEVGFVATLKTKILEVLSRTPGLTDREITNLVKGRAEGQQAVNQACRQLETSGILMRRKRDDGKIGNYPTSRRFVPGQTRHSTRATRTDDTAKNGLQEDNVKAILNEWLRADGWSTRVAWGQERGVDIEATRGDERWLIEVKGCGSRQPMRVNYFLAILGETLQRMDDANARYSIALPDMAQFRGLWARLPGVAKKRTTITALFVGADGTVRQEN